MQSANTTVRPLSVPFAMAWGDYIVGILKAPDETDWLFVTRLLRKYADLIEETVRDDSKI